MAAAPIIKRFIIASKYYVELNHTTRYMYVAMKDQESAALQGIEQYTLGMRILRDVPQYKSAKVYQQGASRYPGVKKAPMLDITLQDGRIIRLTSIGVAIGTPVNNARTK
jgi:hypothetical protein